MEREYVGIDFHRRRLGSHFGGPVRPGDQVRMRHTVVEKRRTSRADRGLITSRNELINQRDDIPVSIDARWLLATRPT